jgi:ribosomal protein S8E
MSEEHFVRAEVLTKMAVVRVTMKAVGSSETFCNTLVQAGDTSLESGAFGENTLDELDIVWC